MAKVRWFYSPRMQAWCPLLVHPYWHARAFGVWGRIGWRYWNLQVTHG